MLDALRVAYRRLLLRARRPRPQRAGVDGHRRRGLSDLADCTLEAALAVARAEVGDAADECRLAVIGMGKCGGRELNYVSDVDVIFVAEPRDGADEPAALRAATALATGPDAGLLRRRPPRARSGRSTRRCGPRASRARWCAPSPATRATTSGGPRPGSSRRCSRPGRSPATSSWAREYVDAVAPLVWSAADARRLRRGRAGDAPPRRAAHPARLAPSRELKLGPGGLRDVEFAVQLLQLVHGRGDVMLRSAHHADRARRPGHAAGTSGATTPRRSPRPTASCARSSTGSSCTGCAAPTWCPTTRPTLRRLGRSLGFRQEPVAELGRTWRRHAREVRRLHEKLFYRPLLQAVARLDAGRGAAEPRGRRAAAGALGYADPQGALRHLEALTAGVSRRAAHPAHAAAGDARLVRRRPRPGRRACSASGGSATRSARRTGTCGCCATSGRRPSGWPACWPPAATPPTCCCRRPRRCRCWRDEADLRAPLARGAARRGAVRRSTGTTEPASAVAAVRAIRRRELFRIAVAELLRVADPEQAGPPLTDVAVGGTRRRRSRVARSSRGPAGHASTSPSSAWAASAGRELGFGSDADVLFVHEPRPGVEDEAALRAAAAVADELRRLLDGSRAPTRRWTSTPTCGPRASRGRWCAPWARTRPTTSGGRGLGGAGAAARRRVAGDEDLGAAFLALIDPLRWSTALTEDDVPEIRRIKARVESERLPRGADPNLHTKLGRGGLADVEWTVQLLQMPHAGRRSGAAHHPHPGRPRGGPAGGLIVDGDAAELAAAWRMATGSATPSCWCAGGRATRCRATSASWARWPASSATRRATPGRMVDDYRRVTRRARQVFERLFYGLEDDADQLARSAGDQRAGARGPGRPLVAVLRVQEAVLPSGLQHEEHEEHGRACRRSRPSRSR